VFRSGIVLGIVHEPHCFILYSAGSILQWFLLYYYPFENLSMIFHDMPFIILCNDPFYNDICGAVLSLSLSSNLLWPPPSISSHFISSHRVPTYVVWLLCTSSVSFCSFYGKNEKLFCAVCGERDGTGRTRSYSERVAMVTTANWSERGREFREASRLVCRFNGSAVTGRWHPNTTVLSGVAKILHAN
jgi:hypothetical protein